MKRMITWWILRHGPGLAAIPDEGLLPVLPTAVHRRAHGPFWTPEEAEEFLNKWTRG